MYVFVNIWFLCFVIAAVYCCIHVCSVTGEISQRKRRKRAKTTELKQLFSKNYLNSLGGLKVQPWISPFYTPRRPSGHVIAFYVQCARLSSSSLISLNRVVGTFISRSHLHNILLLNSTCSTLITSWTTDTSCTLILLKRDNSNCRYSTLIILADIFS